MINLQITTQGGIQMLQDDRVDLREFGRVDMSRASHVEFSNQKQKWFVQSARTLEILRDDFDSREEALAWEKEFYSPGGAGWNELTDDQKEER